MDNQQVRSTVCEEFPNYTIYDNGWIESRAKRRNPHCTKGNPKTVKGIDQGYLTAPMGKTVHYWVAKYYVPNPEPGNKNQVHHIDNNGRNNYYTNLMWVTPKENNYYKHRDNNYKLENHNRAKLNNQKVEEICEKFKKFDFSKSNTKFFKEIAEEYEVNWKTIKNIWEGTKWMAIVNKHTETNFRDYHMSRVK